MVLVFVSLSRAGARFLPAFRFWGVFCFQCSIFLNPLSVSTDQESWVELGAFSGQLCHEEKRSTVFHCLTQFQQCFPLFYTVLTAFWCFVSCRDKWSTVPLSPPKKPPTPTQNFWSTNLNSAQRGGPHARVCAIPPAVHSVLAIF